MGSIFRLLKTSLVVIAVALPSVPARATRVQPMVYELTPSGTQAQQDVRVENNSDRPLPLELRVERRFIAADGVETRKPAEDDFVIFPPQAIVPPNGFQTFRVKYVGDQLLTKSALYVITVAQLPLEGAAAPAGVQILVNLGTSVAVSPPSAAAHVAVTSVVKSSDGSKVSVTLANTGDRFARLYNGSMIFSAGSDRVVLEGEPLRQAIEQPLIEAKSTRVLSFPIPEKLAGRDVVVSFSYTSPTSAR